jgi:hypothetical protein
VKCYGQFFKNIAVKYRMNTYLKHKKVETRKPLRRGRKNRENSEKP